MRRPRRPAFDHGEPIRRIDTLPLLIFCTLIALLALLWASRTPTHALLIDLPLPVPNAHETPAGTVHVIGTTVLGAPTLDGIELNEAQMDGQLSAIANSLDRAGIVFEPADNARYEDALRTLSMVKRAGLADSCFYFGGIERNRKFDTGYNPHRLTLEPPFVPPQRYVADCGESVFF